MLNRCNLDAMLNAEHVVFSNISPHGVRQHCPRQKCEEVRFKGGHRAAVAVRGMRAGA